MANYEGRIRYFAEKTLFGSDAITTGAFSPTSTFLAVVKGPRVSIHAISGTRCDLAYIQDSPKSRVSAIAWCSDDSFITGYEDGSFVTTVISFSKFKARRVIYSSDVN